MEAAPPGRARVIDSSVTAAFECRGVRVRRLWFGSHPRMALLKALNLGAKFLLELAALAAFAWWGGTVGHGVVSVLCAIAAPLLAAVLWGRWAAPRAKRRLPLARRVPFELAVFALAAVRSAPSAWSPGACWQRQWPSTRRC